MSALNNPRVLLWGALALLLLADYDAWMRDFGARSAPASVTSGAQQPGKAAAPANDLGDRVPQAPASSAAPAAPGSAPAAAAAPPAPATATSAAAAATPAAGTGPEPAALVHVRTDVLDVEISTRGGTLVQADLLQYPKVKGEAPPVRLENHDEAGTLYELQSGLAGGGSEPYPTHLAAFASVQEHYALDGGTELRVPLTWRGGNGVSVTKTFVFHRGSYRIDLEYEVHNGGTAAWEVSPYAQILRNDPPTKRSYFNTDSYAFHGPAMWDGTKYRKLDVSDDKDKQLALEVTNGWIAALQHFFVSAIVPPPGTAYRMTLGVSGEQFMLAALGPARSIAPGDDAAFRETLFVGPKLQAALEAAAPGLGYVADYGHLWFLARPLFVALNYVHQLTGNWGVAIILVTFLLKLLFYPLSEASGRSMAKMKMLQPRIKNLQETYADDREKLGRAMMELYKREKVNPVAGCLPIIIQIPVFIAYYWVLLESAEMRQAPFAFWIHDLSARDPLYILPAIMAGAMFVQYKLNPAPPDPVQAKVFMIMPLVMSVTFAFFPAGLVLYWVTNTILSIAQQWNINRRIGALAA
ncbi:MAG TPA: membrane protein insertase YidC, partial [Steroidobacteraceae bacterium]|nr:membrane protein insertase YidC [Steroidobacteraceae bacterium]